MTITVDAWEIFKINSHAENVAKFFNIMNFAIYTDEIDARKSFLAHVIATI